VVETPRKLRVLSRVLGGQDSRPDCRRCGRSTRQFPRLELSLLDLLRQFDSADRDARRIESLETQHWPSPLFHSAMILLHNIVQVLLDRSRTRRDRLPSDFNSRTARCDAAYASRVITRGVPLCLIALRKKRLAAATSRRSLSRKSTVCPYLSTARYR